MTLPRLGVEADSERCGACLQSQEVVRVGAGAQTQPSPAPLPVHHLISHLKNDTAGFALPSPWDRQD